MSRKPRSHVRILIYRTWAIKVESRWQYRWEILINIYLSSIKTMGCFYIYLSGFVIAIHSTLSRRNANLGQELMSSSVFICQVSIDHTFGSHRMTHLAKWHEINCRGSTTLWENLASMCTNAPPQKKSGRASVHRQEKIMHHSKNKQVKSWWLNCGVVIDRDILLLPLEMLYLREIQISNHF